jgi:hypothetical protein
MAAELIGITDWWMERDSEGYRDYHIEWLIEAAVTDGPANVHLCPMLPIIGSYWSFLADLDYQVSCRPDMEVRPVVKGEINDLWLVTQLFSNRPLRRCSEDNNDDPLSQPPTASGTFVKIRQEAKTDKDGNPLLNPAFERIRGEIVEVDAPRPTVQISRNVSSLQLPYVTSLFFSKTVLNDSPLWGLPARKVKLANYTWNEHYQGSCLKYYTEVLEFEVDDFDRPYTATGYMKLKDGGTPGNLLHYEANRTGADGTVTETYLDGDGAATDTPYETNLEIYGEADLLSLGIPTSF